MGKTTFIDLILGLLNPTSGRIKFTYNDQPVKLDEINIFYMTQSPAVITGTIEENLCYINKNTTLSDNQLWSALDKVSLKQTILNRDGLDIQRLLKMRLIYQWGKNND